MVLEMALIRGHNMFSLRTQVRGHGFDIRSGHILLFHLPLIQEGQLSVTGEILVCALCTG